MGFRHNDASRFAALSLTLVLLSSIAAAPARAARSAAVELPLTPYFADLRTVSVELDCVNTQPVLLAPHAYKQLGVEPVGNDDAPVRLELAGLGPVTVDARPVDAIYDGLLNSAFFRERVVTFDLRAIRVWVAPRDGK